MMPSSYHCAIVIAFPDPQQRAIEPARTQFSTKGQQAWSREANWPGELIHLWVQVGVVPDLYSHKWNVIDNRVGDSRLVRFASSSLHTMMPLSYPAQTSPSALCAGPSPPPRRGTKKWA